MEFKGLKKIHDGHFIHRYDITYETVDGKEKVYEMISRNPDISTAFGASGKNTGLCRFNHAR